MIFYLRRKGTTFQLRNQSFSIIYTIKILKKRGITQEQALSLF